AGILSNRKYVNFYAYEEHPNNQATILNSGCRLSVIRFTPIIQSPTPEHGVAAMLPDAATNSAPPVVTGNDWAIIYQLDLDNLPNGGLATGDVILAMGECEANYAGTGSLLFRSKVLLVDSATTDPVTVAISRANDFGLS